VLDLDDDRLALLQLQLLDFQRLRLQPANASAMLWPMMSLPITATDCSAILPSSRTRGADRPPLEDGVGDDGGEDDCAAAAPAHIACTLMGMSPRPLRNMMGLRQPDAASLCCSSRPLNPSMATDLSS
jgi:hypothetical protein